MKKCVLTFISLMLCTSALYSQTQSSHKILYPRDIKVTETTRESPVLQEDELDFTVRLRNGVILNTSSGYEVDVPYAFFEVFDSKDPALVGCPVVCKIVESRKSNLSGSEGRLVIRPLYIQTKDGECIRLLPTDIYRRGLNRTNIKTWLTFPLVPLMFVAGSKAEVKKGEVIHLRMDK